MGYEGDVLSFTCLTDDFYPAAEIRWSLFEGASNLTSNIKVVNDVTEVGTQPETFKKKSKVKVKLLNIKRLAMLDCQLLFDGESVKRKSLSIGIYCKCITLLN